MFDEGKVLWIAPAKMGRVRHIPADPMLVPLTALTGEPYQGAALCGAVTTFMVVDHNHVDFAERCNGCMHAYAARIRRARRAHGLVMPPSSAPRQANTQHGVDCEKIPHRATGGYLHDPEDDAPYDVDGVSYCGRCHWAL